MSNQIFELFGHMLEDHSVEAVADRRAAHCPFMNGPCDGGGNRHQTTVNLDKLDEKKPLDADFKAFYENSGLTQVVPGVCSIKSEHETWIVCPRRLFGFKNSGNEIQKHELEALMAMDLPKGILLGIWAEVKLNWKQINATGENETFQYNFDYVIAPIADMTVGELVTSYEDITVSEIILEAKKGDPALAERVPSKRNEKQDAALHNVPILNTPIIIEVMTASTSGSDTKNGTDIAAVFKKALIGHEHKAPGINKRQVWGRMGTQLFSKSAAAERWDGRTYWLLQDQFLEEIERSTLMSVKRIKAARENSHQGELISKDAINLSIFDVDKRTGVTNYRDIINGYSGLDYKDMNDTFLGIILPNAVPPKSVLLKAMLRSKPAATFTLTVLE